MIWINDFCNVSTGETRMPSALTQSVVPVAAMYLASQPGKTTRVQRRLS